MGYSVKNIQEIETFDFSSTKCTKETVRKSLDGTLWIIEGDNINDYTYEEIIQYLNNNDILWNKYK